MEYKYTEMKRHPLRDCWMVIIKISNMPPYFGTKKQCEKARKHAEKKASELFANKKVNA